MEILNSIDVYHALIKECRSGGKNFTNDMLSDEETERHVALGRLSYTENEAGYMFFVDEEKYYRAVFNIDADKSFKIESTDKPVVIRTRYINGKKRNKLLKFEKQLSVNGFSLNDTAFEIRISDEDNKEKWAREYKRAKRLLESKQYRVIVPDYRYYGQIKDLYDSQDMLRYFHEPYRTEDEIRQRFERGEYLAVVDAEDRVLAYGSGYELNDCWYGDSIIVGNEYKMYGLAPVIEYYRGLLNNKTMRLGVLLTYNTPSINFHRRMGWEFTNKYIDHWLRDAVK